MERTDIIADLWVQANGNPALNGVRRNLGGALLRLDRAAWYRAWRRVHPEIVKARNAAYRRDHLEEQRARDRAKAKARRAADPQKEKDAKRRWYLTHREELAAKREARKTPEFMEQDRQRSRAYRAAHLEERRAYARKRGHPERKREA